MKNAKEITLDDIKSMIRYMRDTDDEKIVENYALRLLELAKQFDEGVKHIIPTVVINKKTYYGKELLIKDYKIYIDGVEVEGENINYSGNLVINNKSFSGIRPTIQINGNLVTKQPIITQRLTCRSLQATEISVIEKLTADNINANIVKSGMINCNDIKKCNELSVEGDLNFGGNISCNSFSVKGTNNAKIIEVQK